MYDFCAAYSSASIVILRTKRWLVTSCLFWMVVDDRFEWDEPSKHTRSFSGSGDGFRANRFRVVDSSKTFVDSADEFACSECMTVDLKLTLRDLLARIRSVR
jgi:hypothetical protein